MNSALAAPALLLTAALLAWGIDSRSPQAPAAVTIEDTLGRILGGAREAVGDVLFLKADAAYHGGVVEERQETAEQHAREGHIEDAHEAPPPADWIDRVNRLVRSHAHYHLEGGEKGEILPYFALATSLDPHNVEAVLTTAYWLDREFRKPEEAARVLEKGAADNPDSWEIPFQLANIYFHRGDKKSAARHYARALELTRGKEIERYYAVDLRWFLGQSLEGLDCRDEAAALYREALALYGPDENPRLKEEISGRLKALLY